jgi:hypothetical protein
MENNMKKSIIYLTIIIGVMGLAALFSSCQSPAVSAKLGVQIWGENCGRCHSTASPATFSDIEWDAVSMHMNIRANLTQEESRKVLEFLQSAN